MVNKYFLKLKTQNLKKYLCFILFMFFLSVSFYFRQNIYFYTGNQFFGGKIGYASYHISLYNIEVSEYFLLKANDFDKKIIWNNYQLSRIYFIKGDLYKAVQYSNRELEYFPDNCRTHYIRGLAYGYKNDLDNAISDFEKFNTCFPLSWAGHNDLAWFWFRKGDMQKVVDVVEGVITSYDDNPWIQNTYGTALMNLGRGSEALLAFEKAKVASESMTETDWGKAYPGNDPSIYGKGLKAMRETIDKNIQLLKEGDL